MCTRFNVHVHVHVPAQVLVHLLLCLFPYTFCLYQRQPYLQQALVLAGVLVRDVMPLADAHGVLKPEDVILKFDGV